MKYHIQMNKPLHHVQFSLLPSKQRLFPAMVNHSAFTSHVSFRCLHPLSTSPGTSAISQPLALLPAPVMLELPPSDEGSSGDPSIVSSVLACKWTATSLDLGDLQIGLCSSEVQISEMMHETPTLALLPLLLILASYYKPNTCAQLDFIL